MMGVGKNITLWHDRWHPLQILYYIFGYRVIHDAASNVKAKVASVLQGKKCHPEPASPYALVAMEKSLERHYCTHLATTSTCVKW